MSVPKYYLDGVSKIDADTTNGIVKLTFSVTQDGKPEDEVQLIFPVDALNQTFQTVGNKMRDTFGQGGGPGGPGGPGGGRRGGPGGPGQQRGPGGKPKRDLTET